MHIDNRVWRDFFDGLFSIGSLLLAIFFGAALGNVVRGVPLMPDHYFFLPLWTDFKPGPNPGVLDWYTVLAAGVALIALTIHGANYLAVKTNAELGRRARAVARRLWPLLALVTVASCVATLFVRPQVTRNYTEYPIGFVIPAVVAGSLIVMFTAQRAGNDRRAFLSSCAYLMPCWAERLTLFIRQFCPRPIRRYRTSPSIMPLPPIFA